MSHNNDVSKNIFSNTRLPLLKQSLILRYEEEQGEKVFDIASGILEDELKNLDDRGNKAIHMHLCSIILPGVASYKALIELGVNVQEAIDFVRNELCNSAKPMGNFMSKLKNVPFIYTIFRILINPIMKKSYPKEGWTVTWKENSKEKISFHITTCLYCEELKKRKCFELCPAFCITDHVAYDPLSPRIVFKREGTLADEHRKICDFCFVKEHNK
jgi:hypothetical protein